MRILADISLQPYLAATPSEGSISLVLKDNKPAWIEGVFGRERKDLSRLTEPIHRKFANMNDDPDTILAFTKRYGPLTERWQPGDEFRQDISDWQMSHRRYCAWWDNNRRGEKWDAFVGNMQEELLTYLPEQYPKSLHEAMEGESSTPSQGTVDFNLVRNGKNLSLQLVPSHLWQYLLLLLLREKLGMLRRCENPECSAPRYVARRRDQAYCSTDCAGLIVKRDWWAKHGNEWRRKRKEQKGRH